MRRRRLGLLALVSLLGRPAGVLAQQPSRPFRIGILGTVPVRTAQASDGEAARIWSGFFEGLKQLGYVDGRDVVFEGRFSDGRNETLPSLADDLVRLKVDIIVAAAHTPAAAKLATSTIPIVMTNGGNPVESGLVASLARPGGNVTGLTSLVPQLVGKNLQLLQETMPQLSLVGVLANPLNPVHVVTVPEAVAAARALGLKSEIAEARTPAEIPGAIASAVQRSVRAMLVLGDAMFFRARHEIAELASRHRLVLMTTQREFVTAGALLGYGVDLHDNFRRAAVFVDKILKGANPAELPVEQPTKFELAVNLRTAQALGVEVPSSVLARADLAID